MAVTLTQLTGTFDLPNGDVPRHGKIRFRFSGWAREGGNIFVPGPVEFNLSSVGGLVDCWLQSTTVLDGFVLAHGTVRYWAVPLNQAVEVELPPVAIPAVGPVGYAALLSLPAPAPTVPDALAQALAAQAGAEAAAAQAALDMAAADAARDEAVLYGGIRVDGFAGLASLTPAQMAVGKYAVVTSTGDIYQRVASGGHLNYSGSGGVRLVYAPVFEVRLAALGMTVSSTTAEIAGMWNAAMELSQATGLKTVAPKGNFVVTQLDLPTFAAADVSQTPAREIEICGHGQLATQFSLAPGDATSRYIIGHPTADGTTLRATNSFVHIHHMGLLSRGVVGVNQPNIQLDNTWGGHFHDLLVGGNMGGADIDVYSFTRGGAQSCVFERIRDFKHQQWVNASSPTQYLLTSMRARGARYMFHFRGPVDSIGKCNNHIVRDCEAYYCAFGMVDTLPFASTGSPNYTSNTFPNGGGNDWIGMDRCFIGLEGWQKIETGVFSAVASQTAPTLIASGAVNTGVDVFKDCVIRALNPADGYWYSRRITAMDAGRAVTLASAFPFTLTTATEYEIAYSDALHFSQGGHAGIRPHLMRHSTRAYSASVVNSRCEEGVLVVKMSYASTNMHLTGCNTWSNRQEGFMVFDSTGERPQYWTPDIAISHHPIGARSANAHLIAQTLLLGNAEDASSDSVISMRRINKTGLVLPSGTWGRVSTNQGDLVAPLFDSSATWTPHLYFWNPQEQDAQPDDEVSCVAFGHLPVNVWLAANQVCNVGDPIIASTYATSGNVGAIVAAVAPTGWKILGRLTQAITQGPTAGVAKPWAWISPMVGPSTAAIVSAVQSGLGFLKATATVDFPSVAAGATSAAITVTVTGAAVGAMVNVTPPNAVAAAIAVVKGVVTAPNTVSLYLTNAGTAALDVASGSYTIHVWAS